MWSSQKESELIFEQFVATRDMDERRFKKVAIGALILLLAVIATGMFQWLNYIDLTLR